jgi:hypothetical protein
MDLKPIRRTLRQMAIPDLTVYLVMGQGLCFLIGRARPDLLERLMLIPARVLEGEWWRVFTFIFYPPTLNPLWLFFVLSFFFMMGTALERLWGTASYNLYLLIGYAATAGVAFLFPEAPTTGLFIQSSVFFAFAFVYPDYPIRLYFLVPIPAKWLALIDAVLVGMAFTFGSWQTKVLILASVLNFLVFFRKEIREHAKMSRRRMKIKHEQVRERYKPLHVCAVCGINDQTHRNMDFRYCPGCGGKLAYCTEHLNNHVHRAAV